MVSLVVKTHVQDIFARLKDISSELGDLEIVTRNGSFLTSKLVMFSLLPQMEDLLCKIRSCAGQGHDTITIVMPDMNVEDIVEAFEKLFDGNPKDVLNIFGYMEMFPQKENEEKEKQSVTFVYAGSRESGLEEVVDDSQCDTIQKIKSEDDNIVSIDLHVQKQNNEQLEENFINSKFPLDNTKICDSHYYCQECGKKFLTKRKVQRHVREVHAKGLTIPRPAKIYPCECGVEYSVRIFFS